MNDADLERAKRDLDALTRKLGRELHEIADHEAFRAKLYEIAEKYGPLVLEAALRIFLRFAGVPPP